MDWGELKSKLEKTANILFILLLLTSAVGHYFGPGATAAETTLPDEPVTNCIDPPSRPFNQSAKIVGTVTQVDNETVTISYVAEKDITEEVLLGISLPQGSTLVESEGFHSDSITIGGPPLQWNESSSEHYITYRMSGGERHSYPNGDNWMLAGTPNHRGANVHLKIVPRGFVGGNLLYIGDYSTVSASEGCQNFTAVIPTQSFPGRERLIKQRLSELQVAARSIPTGTRYSEIRVFAIPSQFQGNIGGFNLDFEHEFVVSTRDFHRPGSITWIHEYVHTLQDSNILFVDGWMAEATAQYFAYRISVENGFIPPRLYDSYLAQAQYRNWSHTLATADDSDYISYMQGTLVLALIDEQLKSSPNGSASELFYLMNNGEIQSRDGVFEYMESNGVDRSSRNQIRKLLYSGEVAEPPYIMGPRSTPPILRIILGYLATPVIRFISWFLLIIFLLGEGYNRYSNDDSNSR